MPFPHVDLSSNKQRPAVVVGVDSRRSDYTLAFVSSQDPMRLETGEVSIVPTHQEFSMSGLALPSKVRATRLVTLSRSLLTRWIGRLGPLLIAELDRALIGALAINMVPYAEQGRQDERARLTVLHNAGGATALLVDLNLPAS